MGITAIVFEERLTSTDRDHWTWIRAERAATPKGAWQRPETSSNVLNSWFSEMRLAFPPLAEADPDDLRGTDYSFYKHFVWIEFAGPVAEECIVTAWKLAHKHGLRVLVGDELLPRAAPEGERQVHIPALDGRKGRAQLTGRPANVCIAVLDPAFAPASGAKQWVLDQLDVEQGSDDPSSIMTSSRLKQWNDEFDALPLSVHPQMRFFQKFILLRIHPKDLDQVASAALSSAKKACVGLSIFENL